MYSHNKRSRKNLRISRFDRVDALGEVVLDLVDKRDTQQALELILSLNLIIQYESQSGNVLLYLDKLFLVLFHELLLLGIVFVQILL